MADKTDSEVIMDFMADLPAHIEGMEKCFGVIMLSLVRHHPEILPTLKEGFLSFASSARRDKKAETQIDLFERMAQWIEQAEGPSPDKSPTPPPPNRTARRTEQATARKTKRTS